MTSTSSYVLPEAPGSDGVDGGGEPSAIISPEELEARVDVDELLGLLGSPDSCSACLAWRFGVVT